MTDLKKLLEVVEVGGKPGNDGTLYRIFGNHWLHAWNILEGIGGLTEAHRLHVSLLHERVVKNETWSKRYGGTIQLIGDHGRVVGQGSSEDDDPARAWLIAILKALIAEDQR
ncbi:MAG: hypothetical protein ABJ360_22470 [Roseobacter sp.]